MLHTQEFLSILLLLLLLLGSAVSLEVKISPEYSEIGVGQSKFFLCEVSGEAKEIDWFLPNGEKVQPNRPDLSVTHSDELSSILIIYNADVNKAGPYKCVARNGDEESDATVNVVIFQQLDIRNAPSLQEFKEGDNANVVCDVVGSPPPRVTWKLGDVKLKPEKDVRYKILDNNHLQIRSIRKMDEGTYTCEGRIMVRGEISFKNIQVIVNVPPTVRPRQLELNATEDRSQSVTLACDADGFPDPNVTWMRNNMWLESGEKYSFTEDGSEMTIRDVMKVDQGEYMCIATNKAGKEQQEISLNVFVPPRITFLENQTASEQDEQVTLTCEAIGDPTPVIVWSFGERIFREGEQEPEASIFQASWTRPETHKSLDGKVMVRSDARVSSLVLKRVLSADAGAYVCTARSSIGQTREAVYLEVQYAPKISGPVVTYTWEGNSANVSCEIVAHPAASVFWYRDGLLLPAVNATNMRVFSSTSGSYLEVTPESQSDFGSYNCTATNTVGMESKEFLLVQAEVPSAPMLGRAEPLSTSVRLQFAEPEANGGVPVLWYKVEWRAMSKGTWMEQVYEIATGDQDQIVITGLMPENEYEVKISAVNGKGQGDSSPPVLFRTGPIREPRPPKLEGRLQPLGNALRVGWSAAVDGGSAVTHYLLRYKPKQGSRWKPELRLPGDSEFVLLSGLDWDTEYELYVVAENRWGKSQPAALSFRTSSAPTTAPAADSPVPPAGLAPGAVVGFLLLVFFLLLAAVDVACFFLNKCGFLMCIAVHVCGKSGPGGISKDFREGIAAFSKDESKEPIVEVRTEEEITLNHDTEGQAEPNETTPLTDPESTVDVCATVVDLLPSEADADPAVRVPQSSTPKAGVSSHITSSQTLPTEAPLVDLCSVPAHPLQSCSEAPGSEVTSQ